MERLRQRADFLAVANGARANFGAFTLQSRRRDEVGPARVGFTVTKKNGTATERNRIRRRLREAVKRAGVISMRPDHDYVLVGRRDALTRDFAAMLEDLGAAIARVNRQTTRAFSSEVGTGSRKENASKRNAERAANPNDETVKR